MHINEICFSDDEKYDSLGFTEYGYLLRIQSPWSMVMNGEADKILSLPFSFFP